MAEHTLMAHQNEGVAFLESVDGIGALLWEPGVGKTGATLAWIDRLAARQQEVRAPEWGEFLVVKGEGKIMERYGK